MTIELTDIQASILNKTLIQEPFFRDAEFLKTSRGRLMTYSGGFTAVHPCIVNKEKWAFRCWHTPVQDAKTRYAYIGEAIQQARLPFFCSFEYIEKGLIVKGESIPITKMRWIEGQNLKEYICTHCQEKHTMRKLAQNFLDMVLQLHAHHMAHGDLQHGNIMVSDSGQLYLVDYDSMYVPAMGSNFTDVITGLIDYQHPARKQNRYSSEKLDYFSEVVIYISLLAIAECPYLVRKYNLENRDALLFIASDFESLKSLTTSPIYHDLTNLDNAQIDKWLKVMERYLSVNDINLLTPIDKYLMSIDIDCPAVAPVDEAFTIRWTAQGAKSVEVSGFGKVNVADQRTMTLSQPQTLIFTLCSGTGFKTERTITIKVAHRAVIKHFTADKAYTLDSVPVTLSWDCAYADEVTLVGMGRQKATGSQVVYPKQETQYTLRVKDAFGTQSRSMTIKTLPLPVIKTLLVPAPRINSNMGIVYHAPQCHASIPTPTFDTGLCKLDVPKIPTLKASPYFVHPMESPQKQSSKNIFKSLFSFFYKEN